MGKPLFALGLSLVALISVVLSTGCASTARQEQETLRELALHAYDEGIRFMEADNHELAIDRLNRSLFLSPRPAAYYQLGRAHETVDEPIAAAEAYLEALKMAPDYSEARLALMELGYDAPGPELMEDDGKTMAEAFAEIEREIQDRRLRRLEEETGLTEAEREALRRQIEGRMAEAADARRPTLSEVRAALFPAGAEDAAVPSALSPTYADDREIILNTYPYHFANAQRFQQNKEYEKAAEEYRNAIAADPARIEARLNLGDVMMRLERYTQAQFHYERAREQFPVSARPMLKLGNYYNELGRLEEAEDYYRRALEMDPNYAEAYNNLAAMQIRNRDYAAAIETLRKATEQQPDYAMAWLNMGVAYENAGDREAALEAYRKYVDLGGDRAPEVRKWIAEME